MRVTVTQATLNSELGRVVATAGGRSTLEVVRYVRLETSEGRLSATTTDLDCHACTVTKDCRVEADGVVLVPAVDFGRLVALLPPGPIVLSVQGLVLRIDAPGDQSYSIAGIDPVEFPEPPAMADDDPVPGPRASVLSHLLEQVAPYVETKGAREALQGIHLEWAEGHLRAVATNGTELAISEAPIEGSRDPVILFPAAATGVSRLFDADEELTFRKTVSGGAYLVVEAPSGRVLHVRSLGSTYPNYRQILAGADKDEGVDIQLARADLLTAAKRAVVVSEAANKRTAFSVAGDRLTLEPRGQDRTGVCHVNTVVGREGEPWDMNAGKLSDMLSKLKAPHVRLRQVAPKRPLKIEPEPQAESTKELRILMPLIPLEEGPAS